MSGTNFLTGIFIARFLGIEEFGIYTLAWMMALFVNSIQMALISLPMMTVGPKQSAEDKRNYYGAVVLHQLVFSMLSSLCLWLGVFYSERLNPEWGISHLASPLAMASFFFQNQDFLRRLCFTENKPIFSLISDVISYFGRMVFLLLLLLYELLTISSVLWVSAGCSALALIIGFSQFNKLVFSVTKTLEVLKRHWVLSKWMVASAIMQWTSGNYFIIAAGIVLGPVAVGALKAAQNIIGVTHILFQGLDNIVPSTASRIFAKGSVEALKKYLARLSIWGGAGITIIAFLVIIFPEYLLNVFYGKQYQGYEDVLRWYAIYYVLMFFSLAKRYGLRVIEKTESIFLSHILMTIFSIFFANYSIEKLGIYGAVIGMIGTQIIMLVCVQLFFNYHIRIITVGRD
ncbi:MAG: hypothetical protein MJA28_00730 [Gammaproteobacteria bacterium]|nr:hypothetical protein [Gammaproteobacteria bacterium]